MHALHTRSPCPWYYRYRIFLILAEFGHSDRNGEILCKKRKNSAKIGMVGSYAMHWPSSVVKKTDPHQGHRFGLCFLRLWKVEVHFVSVKVSVKRIAATLVEAKRPTFLHLCLKFKHQHTLHI